MLRKRADGFHDIETIFYPIPLKDSLEIIPAPGKTVPVITIYGAPIDGKPEDNLCYKAWQLLKKDFAGLPAVDIHILKNIPTGGGLGGEVVRAVRVHAAVVDLREHVIAAKSREVDLRGHLEIRSDR